VFLSGKERGAILYGQRLFLAFLHQPLSDLSNQAGSFSFDFTSTKIKSLDGLSTQQIAKRSFHTLEAWKQGGSKKNVPLLPSLLPCFLWEK
jgi:hypothetical protein